MGVTFFVWADRTRILPARVRAHVPEKMVLAEHSWVTTYEPVSACPPDPDDGEYWYCLGDCHTTPPENSEARLLCSGPGDVEFARSVARPHETRPERSDRWECAGLWFGHDGVCHQIANRILYATGGDHGDPLTVEGVKGYNLSVTFFGMYGGRGKRRLGVEQEWQRQIQEWKRQKRDRQDDE